MNNNLPKAVAIFHPEGNYTNNPNLYGLITLLLENGWTVHLFVHPHDSQKFGPDNARLFVHAIPMQPGRQALDRGILFPLHTPKDVLTRMVREKLPRFSLVIGVDLGIVEAAAVARAQGVPHALISYEIYFHSECGEHFKRDEVEACRDIAFAVCQDSVRAAHLARENRIPLSRIINMPVAGRGLRPGRRTFFIHNMLNLDHSIKIALYIGEVKANWAGIDQLLSNTMYWPEDWMLFLHHRYDSSGIKALVEDLKTKGLKQVMVSPLPSLPRDKLHVLLHASDIGICLYVPTYDDPGEGKNLEHVGMASGKFTTYIQHGLPVLVNDQNEMGYHVSTHNLGIRVSDIGQIHLHLGQTTRDFLMSRRDACLNFFAAYCDLNVKGSAFLQAAASDGLCLNVKHGAETHIENISITSKSVCPMPCPEAMKRDQDIYVMSRDADNKGWYKTGRDDESLAAASESENFSNFVYARKLHFNLFKKLDILLYGQTVDPNQCDLKKYQDLLALAFITANIPPGARILEVGGGDSRILAHLAQQYECWNIDKFEGVGSGPRIAKAADYRIILDYMGAFNSELPDEYFDFVFSISALEHTPQKPENYSNILNDINRVLKPGSWSLHCFDVVFKPDGFWTNPFLPYLFEHAQPVCPMPDPAKMERDPDLYVMSRAAYNRGWNTTTGKTCEDFGRPTSINILWRKPQATRSGNEVKTRIPSSQLSNKAELFYRLDIPGWMDEEDLKIIANLAKNVPSTGIIVEVGSWLGRSTYAWAANTAATVYAIDLWEWMPKEYNGPSKEKVDLKGDPFVQFMSFAGNLSNVVPLRRESSGGDWLYPQPDIVFIDAMHQDPWVTHDIVYWEKIIKPGGTICGDDYSQMFPAVMNAANRCAHRLQSKLETPGQKFWMVKK